MDLKEILATLDELKDQGARERYLKRMLSKAWGMGYDTCYGDGGEQLNPFEMINA
jgi:hypothetical protein